MTAHSTNHDWLASRPEAPLEPVATDEPAGAPEPEPQPQPQLQS